MKFNKKFLSVFFIAIFAIVLVACGGKTTTVAPTTGAPTTVAPTTVAPTTQAPTTVAPTTQAPTTVAPTTTEAPTTETTTEEPTPLYETVTDVFIHLNRELGMVEDLEVKAYGKGLDNEWPSENEVFFDFTMEDEYGIYAVIPFDELTVARSTLGFVIQTTDGNAIHTEVSEIDLANQDEFGVIHVYVDEVNNVTAYSPIEEAPLISYNVGYISHFQPQAPMLITRVKFDDFTRSVIEQTGVTFSGDVTLSDRVKHLVVNYTTTVGIDSEAAIYKAASGSNTAGSYLYLALVMKGSNGASINNLKLAFRYDDNHELIIRDFTDLVDPDYQALPELDSDYQVYLIDIANSLDGLTFVGKSGHVDVAAGGSIVGFHLFADGVGSGTLEIEEVYYTSDPVSTEYTTPFDFLIDDFQKDSVSAALPNVYWCGSVGYLVDKWLIMDSSLADAVYQDEAKPVNELENIEINLRSTIAGGDIYVTPVFDNSGSIVLGTEVLLSTLLNDNEEAVGTLTTAFATKRINLAANSWAANLTGLKFRLASGNGIVTIDYVEYVTITEGAAPVYPVIGTEDVKVFDDFAREEVGATTVYDPNNAVAAANGLYYIITYSDAVNKGQLYMENGALVFDNTVDTGYINFVEASQTGNLGTHKYMVFRLKTDQGGSLDHFRLQTGTDAVTWANELYAAPGMLSIDTPYLANDGFVYLVVDLELSGLLTSFEELTLYYSDAGRLIIDSIFFANDEIKDLDLEGKTVADDVTGPMIFKAGDDYAYNHIGIVDSNTANNRYMVMAIKGSGLDNMRFETYDSSGNSAVTYITDLIGVDGYEYSLDDFSETEYRYLIIDLEASGHKFHPQGIHLHLNNAKVYIYEIFFADTESEVIFDEFVLAADTLEEPKVIDATASGYVYNYIGLDQAVYADYMILEVSGNVESLRFEFINHDETVLSGVKFLSDLRGINGAPLYYEVNTETIQELIVDLKASGITQNIGAMHVHYGDDMSSDDIVTIYSIELNDSANEKEYVGDFQGSFEPMEPVVIDATATGYVYTYVGMDNPVSADYMVLVVDGNVESLRFQFINHDESVVSPVYFLSDLLGPRGNPLIYKVNTENPQEILIDLKASGITQDIKAFHVHYGDDMSSDDIVEISSIAFFDKVSPTMDLSSGVEVYSPGEPFAIDATTSGYVYSYIGLDIALTSERYLAITVSGNVSSLRFQAISVGETFTSATYFLGDLIGVDGMPLQFISNTTLPQTLIIDLYASGLGFDIAAMHVHYGDDAPTTDDLVSIVSMTAYPQINYLQALDLAIGE
jgi:hypothetical protein